MKIQLRNKKIELGNFGIEIEMIHPNRERVAEMLNAAGIECNVVRIGIHSVSRGWKIVPDGSVLRGFELVSPILNGEDGLNQVRTVGRVLNAAGAKVNKGCGLHVHHEAVGFNAESLKKVVKIYGRMEKQIDEMMPKSRRENNNRFCQSVIGADLDYLATRGSHIYSPRRYFKVNLQSYFRQGTVEFRQHSGTVEAKKMVNWILFTALIVDKARGRVSSTKPFKNWVDVKWFLEATTNRMDSIIKDMVDFYTERRKHFAR